MWCLSSKGGHLLASQPGAFLHDDKTRFHVPAFGCWLLPHAVCGTEFRSRMSSHSHNGSSCLHALEPPAKHSLELIPLQLTHGCTAPACFANHIGKTCARPVAQDIELRISCHSFIETANIRRATEDPVMVQATEHGDLTTQTGQVPQIKMMLPSSLALLPQLVPAGLMPASAPA